jgi:hypothetical protein
MTPALKGSDIPPGPYRRDPIKPPTASDQKCPTCRYWLSRDLVAHGETRHPFCPEETPAP